MTDRNFHQADNIGTRLVEDTVERIRQALETIRFGDIQLTIHDGKVVQLDVTKKYRFPAR
jgi:hypothetical protein